MKTSIGSFFVSVREEAKKISWPTRTQTMQTTFIVIAATIIVGAYVGVVDYVLDLIIKNYIIQ